MPTPSPTRTPAQRVRDALGDPFVRTAVLWVFLIVVFVVLFQVFQAQPGAPSPAGGSAATALWRWMLEVLPIAVPALLLAGIFWRIQRFNVANKRGLDLLAAGELAPAAEAFRALALRPLVPAGVAWFNLGLTLLRLADLRGARDAFEAAVRSRTKALHPTAAALLALCEAVAGDLDAAERWIADARRRSASPGSSSRVHLAAEAILRLRRGDAAGAARLLEQTWGEIERSTSADLCRGLRVVRAFAVAHAGGTGQAQAAELLAGARPFRAGEYGWLAAGWPEMARYLAASGLDAVA